jgi:hypothetical protein
LRLCGITKGVVDGKFVTVVSANFGSHELAEPLTFVKSIHIGKQL